MKYLKQFGIIVAISFIGEVLHAVIPLPIPASIYGIILMFLLLETGLLKVSSVKEASAFLIEIMPVMFIPSAAGLLTSWSVLSDHLAAYLVITIVSTIMVMGITGLVTQAVIRIKKKGDSAHE